MNQPSLTEFTVYMTSEGEDPGLGNISAIFQLKNTPLRTEGYPP